jgi:ubiquinone/menaquinone biosynthesis C-methylase UbiE
VAKRKGGISPTYYTVKYLRRSRELYRKYLETKPWIKQLYTNFFQLKPGIRIVDVGCGTGDFTRYLVGLVPGKCKAVGIDQRGVSLRSAETETRRADLSDRISYKKGDAYQIPIDDDYADLVCCRTLLMHLEEPARAVTEMVRIAKPGGIVAAVEYGRMNSFYDPEETEFTRLVHESDHAILKGVRKVESKDYGIGEKLPSMFLKAGLTEVKAELQGEAWMFCDARLDPNYVKATLQFDLQSFQERKKSLHRLLLAGGMNRKRVDSMFRIQERRFKELLSDDARLRRDATISGQAFFLIAGRKKPA